MFFNRLTLCAAGLLVAGVGLIFLPYPASADLGTGAETGEVPCSTLSLAAIDSTAADTIAHRLAQAQTLFWLGVEENGNLDAFAKSAGRLQDAEHRLDVANHLPESFAHNARRRIRVLRSDIQAQQRLQAHRLYNVFPLLRGLPTPSLVRTPSAGTRHLVETPPVVAVRDAIRSLRDDVMNAWNQPSQVHVVVQSRPHRSSLENEALTLLNDSPRFIPHGRDEVAAALPDTTFAAFQRGTLTDAQRHLLAEALDAHLLLIVLLEASPALDEVTAYTASGHLVRTGGPDETLARAGFARDRRDQRSTLFVGHLLLLIASLFLVSERHLHTRRVPAADLLLCIVAFCVGRMLPWALVPVLQTVAPNPRTLVGAAGWWPLLTGIVLLVGIPVLVGLLLLRVGRGSTVPLDRLLGVVGLGVAAYLLGPIVLAAPSSVWGLAAGTALVAGSVGVAAGHVLRPLAPGVVSSSTGSTGEWTALALIGGLMGGGALFAGASAGLLVFGVVAVGAVAWLARETTETTAELELVSGSRTGVEQGDEWDDASDVDPKRRLRRIKRREWYLPPSSTRGDAASDPLSLVHERVKTFVNADGRSVTWLFLCGPSGVGKTATARHIWRALHGQKPDAVWLQKKQCNLPASLTALQGGCPMPPSDSEAYAPFQEALRTYFTPPPTDSHEQVHSHLNEVVDDVVGAFVPFATLFLPPLDAAGSTASPDEIAFSIADTIGTLARRTPTLLLIDDVQWMDPDSRNALRILLQQFQPSSASGAQRESPVQLMILLTSRTPVEDILAIEETSCGEGLSRTDVENATVRIDSLSDAPHRMRLLTSGLGLCPSSAKAIVEHLEPVDSQSGSSEQHGELFWLLEVVNDLIRGDHLVRTETGWSFSETGSTVPVPDRFHDVVREQLEAHPTFQKTLLYATCLGSTFTLSTLTAMHEKMSRSDVLDRLEAIEDTLGWIQDDRTRDDVFLFASSFVLDALRDAFSVHTVGPAGNAPQRVREAHSRAAHGLRTSWQDNPEQVLLQRATHLYAAGAQHAEEAIGTCRAAARIARARYAFEQAHRFLDKAEECAAYTGTSLNLQQDRLQVKCTRAHVQKDKDTPEEVATEGFEYLQKHAEVATPKTICAVLQVGYDAERFEDVAERAARLAQDESVELLYRAEGYHFWSLARERTPSNRPRREKHLRTALAMLDNVPEENRAAQRLRGRIMNSLAELLNRGEDTPPDEWDEARKLYEERLTLNKSLSLGDQHGMAMSHGGLGRLYLYRYRPTNDKETNVSDSERKANIEEAQFHFKKDLTLAEALRDVRTQAQMHSHLGECALHLKDFQEAQDAYEESLRLATGWIGKAFAYAGLVHVHAQQNNCEQLQKAVDDLIETISSRELFEHLGRVLRKALEQAQATGCAIPTDCLPESLHGAFSD